MVGKTYDIQITGGGGTSKQIAEALRQIAANLESGGHVNRVEEKGECEWEDAILFTRITEV